MRDDDPLVLDYEHDDTEYRFRQLTGREMVEVTEEYFEGPDPTSDDLDGFAAHLVDWMRERGLLTVLEDEDGGGEGDDG